jgi:tetratricopeptide (TPR) repeat protein
MGIVALLLGDFEKAVTKLREAIDGLEILGDKSDVGIAKYNLAIALRDSGSFDEALWTLKAAEKELKLANRRPTLLCTLSEMTTIYCKLGKLSLAEKTLAKVGKIATETEDVDALGNFEVAHAVFFVFAKNEGEAKERFERALSLFSLSQFDRARALLICGELETGLCEQVRAHLLEAKNSFRSYALRVMSKKLSVCWASVLESHTTPEQKEEEGFLGLWQRR